MSNPTQFIKDVRKIAKENGISLCHVNVAKIYTPGDKDPFIGYFDPEEQKLVVTTKRTKESYYGILAHESSHMDQYIHDKYLWDKHEPGYNMFFTWMNNSEDINKSIISEAVQDVIRVELDAERRAIEKIKKYNLPVDISLYKKGVNVYLYRYLFALETRIWIGEYQSLLEISSTKLKKSYTKIPRRLYQELKRLHKQQISVP